MVIAGAGMRTFLAKRAFLGLLLVSWIPFLVRAVQIYAAANLPQARFLAPTAETFRQFLDQQQIFVFFVTVYVGAGLIANDRRANALQIYLSKPLTRAEYVFGKLLILMTFLALVTWLPAIVLGLLALSPSWAQTTFHGNVARTGVYEGRGPTKAPATKWTFKTGGPIVGSPVVAGGVELLLSTDIRAAVPGAVRRPRAPRAALSPLAE
jgi:hypothetical protein